METMNYVEGDRVSLKNTRGEAAEGTVVAMRGRYLVEVQPDDFPSPMCYTLYELTKIENPLEDLGEIKTHEEKVEEVVDILMEAEKGLLDPTVFTMWHHYAEALLAAGYTKS